jgi:copper transport protein
VTSRTTPAATRVARRAAACVLLVLVVVVSTALPASAHAVLEQTTPAAGATVTTDPGQVWLRFDQSVGVSGGSMRVLDPAGHRVDLGDTRAGGDAGDQIFDDLRPGLAPGVYVVVWNVVSADGHPISGTFLFGLGVPVDRLQVSTGGTNGTGPASVAITAGVLRFVFETALATLLGAGFFLLVLWPRGLDLPATRRLLLGCWAVGLAATIALLVVQGPYAAGLPLTSAWRPSVFGLAWRSRFGHVSLVRMVLLLAALPLVGTFPRRRATGRFEAAALALGLTVAWATIGHASDDQFTALTIPMLALHVAAVSAWIGGLALLALFALCPTSADDLNEVLPRWSRVAIASVTVTTLTGLVLTWRTVGTPPALPATPYGQLLLAKLALFALVMGVARSSHRWVARRYRLVVHASTHTYPAAVTGPAIDAAAIPGPADAPGAWPAPGAGVLTPAALGALRRRVVAEVVLAVLIFAATAAIANTKTARMSYAPPVSVSAAAGPLRLSLRVSSTWHGPQDLSLQVRDAAGRLVQPQAAEIDLTLPSPTVGPVTVALSPVASGELMAGHTMLPYPGTWYARITVRIDAFNQYSAVTTYKVH